MNNKYLVTIVVPSSELEFDVYIPNNKKVGTIKKHIVESISELSNNTYTKKADEVTMFNKDSGQEYINDAYIKDTDIKNGSIIIIM